MNDAVEGFPRVYTPDQVAKHFGWSERKVREFAREIGACRILGNRMVFTQDDLDALIEASKPAPLSRRSVVPATRPVLQAGGWAELVKLREKQKKESEAAKRKR
ncbi:helix-turn-helix domain-containing protein [Shinella sp.]|uniref:helix-turn-helix domain-containing protein n=1 Tax=Shinella sp. TaxID=1870904 RepID=UPI003F713604